MLVNVLMKAYKECMCGMFVADLYTVKTLFFSNTFFFFFLHLITVAGQGNHAPWLRRC